MDLFERLNFVLSDLIWHVYARPDMYAQTADGLDEQLKLIHWFWAQLHEKLEALSDAKEQVMLAAIRQTENQSVWFAGNFSRGFWRDHPNADEKEAIAFVVEQWRAVSMKLGIVKPN